MSKVEATVPDIGTDEAVEVVELLVEVGQSVAIDDPLIVLETDKATFEVPAVVEGKVQTLSVKVGDKVSEGDVIAHIESSNPETTESESAPEETEVEVSEVDKTAKVEEVSSHNEAPSGAGEEVVLTVPDTGGDAPVEVVEVLVGAGDSIEFEASIIVLESDKATFEVPSSAAGTITEVLVAVGDKVETGSAVAKLMTQASASNVVQSVSDSTTPSKKAPSSHASKAESHPVPAAPVSAPDRSTQEAHDAISNGDVHAGPSVRKLARELGVNLSEVKGTGPKSRIIKDDLHAFVKQRLAQPAAGAVAGSTTAIFAAPPLPDFSAFGEIESVKMSRIHVATAKNMGVSWSNIPHVTQFDEADITDLEQFRKSYKAEAEKRGTKLTPMAFILKACAHVLSQLPQFNVSLDIENQTVIQKHYIHIGVAVDTPDGLVVPVIRNVDQKGIWELAEEVIALAGKARDKKLKPSDMQGGCFTISSLGGIGGTAFTPIVNLPEVAILGISKSEIKPKYDGENFLPRLMMPLSLSYDHRAVNGADAARFTSLLSAALTDIRKLLL